MEVLDRAGGDNDRKLFVYHVQNGRAADLATVLINAFGGGQGAQSTTPKPAAPNLAATGQPSQIGSTQTGFGASGQQTGFGSFQSGSTGYQPGGGFGSNTQTGDQTGTGSTVGGQGSNQPQNVSQTLQLPGGGTPISVSSDETNNAIVVYSTGRQFGIIKDALHQLDVAPLQVVIEAAITEVSLTKELQFGVQWLLKTGVGNVGFSQGTDANPTQVFPGFSYITSGNEITATLNALQSITTVRVISAPKVMVLNNHTASLQVGDQVPVSTGNLATGGTTEPTVVNEIQYMPTGVLLTVTPRVNDSGLVLLDIMQEVSDVKKTTSSNLDTPTIGDRKFTSSIAVHDGQTIALGGLIRDNNSHGRDGIPFLSQIPYLGSLFGSTDNTDDRVELLVLLTPRVIRNAQDAKTITDELKEKIGTVAPPGPPRGVIN
jgi:general secretion pathway protein D